jgi:N6-adenosine-specific RNA methylase IME4
MDDHRSIELVSQARRELAEAKTINEAKTIADKAELARVLARKAKLGLEAQNEAAEVKIRAERLAGQLIQEGQERGEIATSGRPSANGDSVSQLADIDISRKESSRWQQEAAIPADDFEQYVEETKASGEELTSAGVRRYGASNHRRAGRIERINKLAQPDLLSGLTQHYPIIYADPPWRYEHSKTDNRVIENQYPTMALDDICALPVGDIATADSVLFMWATNPKLAEAMTVIDSWGYVYRTNFVWVKDKIGMGYYARQQHELLLVAARGSVPVPEPSNRRSSVVHAPRLEHSHKPTEFYQIIEAMYPEYDRLELFARSARTGWSAWGNEV